ncbi:murein L,D-transpeptidase catalytic domain family protein, partial [Xanthovirga aplysinae]|uniref:murein L,D-transpeptidase catalytic domain family protein n=1 Tax=Xanthovirga aplysinae TaxID=2529853 RepID=UPI0012BB68F6
RKENKNHTTDTESLDLDEISVKGLFKQINDNELNYQSFKWAYKGWKSLKEKDIDFKGNILTIIDFSKPSDQKRFFVIDLRKAKIVYKSLVAHGRNSGLKMATEFSNIPQSLQSSLGLFLTAETYFGKHGLSLRLDGLEEGINDNARRRLIVIHSADYAESSFVQRFGRLGRSFGCPALPKKDYKKVIDRIKDKSALYIYAPSDEYVQKSDLI